jgi:adenosylcobinamide-phosphate synthase
LTVYFIYSALASRCLADEARKVYQRLADGDLAEARNQVGMLVGRETTGLNEPEVIRAVVETTAENTVDGVISPIFYIILGSFFGLAAPLVYAFKAISTLDSMVGYKNEKYLYLGWASARLDDWANYLPARLSGLVIPVSAFFIGKGFRPSFTMMMRDRHNHTSPNCAYPEAAVAGALGVQLGGENVYFGKRVAKPTIGDPCRPLRCDDIRTTIKIAYTASLMTLILGLLIIILFTSKAVG